jgi:SAM-dependent methyltransferase
MNLIEAAHDRFAVGRRARTLAGKLAAIIPPGATLLDVGSGDGLIAILMKENRPDIAVCGTDVLARLRTHIPITLFDGQTIPFPDASFDVLTIVDVLHHTEDPLVLLREAIRVSRRCLLIKDHTLDGFLAGPTLRFMDWVGNAHHGVALPYNYWPKQKWLAAFAQLGLTVEHWETVPELYPWPARMIFGRSLHFIARLDSRRCPSRSSSSSEEPCRAAVS